MENNWLLNENWCLTAY